MDVVWRDLRDGTILSAPRKVGRARAAPGSRGRVRPAAGRRSTRTVPPPPTGRRGPAVPVRIVRPAGCCRNSGEIERAAPAKRAVNQLATQIVSMMEKPW